MLPSTVLIIETQLKLLHAASLLCHTSLQLPQLLALLHLAKHGDLRVQRSQRTLITQLARLRQLMVRVVVIGVDREQ